MSKNHLQSFHKYRKLIFIHVILSALLPFTSLCYGQNSSYEKSVVMIMSVKQEYDFSAPWKKGPTGRGVGSGFIIKGNQILTNAHNVANQRYIEVKKQNMAQRFPAKVLFVGHDCDLALVTVTDQSFFSGTEPLTFGPLPEINSTVQTCGFPVGGRQVSVTEGVVSRLETSTYSHNPASEHLVVQTDAAINPGNSGGPVLQNGKVVGVAFQGLKTADNIGYMIPTTIIDHFMTDIKDGTYDGFGSFGISLFPGLHNSGYKSFLKIPVDQDGIVITSVMINSTYYDILKPGDVLTEIDGFNIDNDGRIRIDGLSLELNEALDRKQIGQKVSLSFYRNGELNQKELIVSKNGPVIPWTRMYDTKPEFRVFAGLTFVKVNRNFLETWGRSWISDMPFSLRYLFIDSKNLNDNPERQDYIVLSEILSDEVNAYLNGFKNQVLESVNNIQINTLDDLDRAFDITLDGYWVVRFIGNDTPMVIDAKAAKDRRETILKKYEVTLD